MNIGPPTGLEDDSKDSQAALALRGGHAFLGHCLRRLVIALAILLCGEISASSTYAAEANGCDDGDAVEA